MINIEDKKNTLLRLGRRAYFGVMYPSFCALQISVGVAVLPRLVVIIPLIALIATFSGQKTTNLLLFVAAAGCRDDQLYQNNQRVNSDPHHSAEKCRYNRGSAATPPLRHDRGFPFLPQARRVVLKQRPFQTCADGGSPVRSIETVAFHITAGQCRSSAGPSGVRYAAGPSRFRLIAIHAVMEWDQVWFLFELRH